MSSPDLTRKETCDDMAVSPAGTTAPDHDKPNSECTLSKTVSPQQCATESDYDKNCTPTTGEKRATRESHIVASRCCDPNATPEQICRTLIGKIDAQPLLSTRPRTSTLDSTSAESMKSTAEALDNLKAHISIFMKTVLDKMLQQDVEELKILMPLGTYLLAQLNLLATCACPTGRREMEGRDDNVTGLSSDSATAAYAIATATVPTAVTTAVATALFTALTASAIDTSVTTSAAAPTAISTTVTTTISTAFTAFAFAASAIAFPSVPRTLEPHRLSARADRRLAALQRQEREREDQQWFAVTATIPTTFTASAIAAPAIATAAVPTAVPTMSIALTAVTTAVTAIAITAIASAPTVISTAVAPTISTAFTAFAIAAIAIASAAVPIAITTALATALTASAITTSAIAPAAARTVIFTAVTPTISTAFTAFAIAAIATAIFIIVTSSISTAFTASAFAASAFAFPAVPRALEPHRLSARADRRQAALQRQVRERFEQQRFEQLRDRKPKATRATPACATLRYLTREIGPVDSHGDRFDISLERSDERPTLSQTGCLSPLRRQDGVMVLHSER